MSTCNNACMNGRIVSVLIGIGLIVIVGGTVLLQRTEKPAPIPSAVTGDSAVIYSMEEVSKHKDATSCCVTISGNVYDLTGWIPLHPGGRAAILGLCGTDGTAALGLGPELVVLLNGAFETLLGVCLAFGLFVRYAALALALHLFVIIFEIGLTAIGVRDFGLALATLALALYGSDSFALSPR